MAIFKTNREFRLSDLDFNIVYRLPHEYKSTTYENGLVANGIVTTLPDEQIGFAMFGESLVADEVPPSTGTASMIGMGYQTQDSTTEWAVGETSISVQSLMNAIQSASNADDLGILEAALSGKDKIVLSDFNDEMSGFGGNDAIQGKGGRDVLDGAGGKDKIDGGAAGDTMTGGTERDQFIFKKASDSNVGAERDVITDFTQGEDLINLKKIDANTSERGNQTFRFIGDADFSGQPGELRFSSDIVSGDVNGDGKADFEIGLTGIAAMTAGDFIL